MKKSEQFKFPTNGNINFSNLGKEIIITNEQKEQYREIVESIITFISKNRIWINNIKMTNHNNLGFSNFIQIEDINKNMFLEFQIEKKRHNDKRIDIDTLKYKKLYSFTLLKEQVDENEEGFVIEDIISTFQSPIYNDIYSIMMNIEYNVDFNKSIFVLSVIIFSYNEDSDINNRFTLELSTNDSIGIRTLLMEHYDVLKDFISK